MMTIPVHVAPPVQPAKAFVFEPGGFADHSTPLILDCWYVAALSAEVSRNIISRRLLGTDVALYRTLAGEPVAVRNRCPHRSFPLAKGKLDGDMVALNLRTTMALSNDQIDQLIQFGGNLLYDSGIVAVVQIPAGHVDDLAAWDNVLELL